jgi:hypothetical protein
LRNATTTPLEYDESVPDTALLCHHCGTVLGFIVISEFDQWNHNLTCPACGGVSIFA